MTVQIPEVLICNGQKLSIDNAPLEAFFELNENRPPFLVTTTMCWRGYEGFWSLVDGKLWLDNLAGYIAKGSLVEIAGEAFRYFREYDIDLENPTMCSRITLENIFPGAECPVFADWFSGEINASLGDEIMRNDEGDDVSVERTLKLGFRNGVLTSEDVLVKFPMTHREIESGLTNPDISVRREFVESLCDYDLFENELTTHQIERGMLDEDRSIRMSFMMYARMKRFAFTSEQIERALTDDNVHIRDYVTGAFREYQFTPFQLERALKDESTRVRANIGMHYCELLTPEQVERGLTDEDGEVRAAFAGGCVDPTPEQIERGLTDENWEVRLWFDMYKNGEL